MKLYNTQEEATSAIRSISAISNTSLTCELDNEGQIVWYSNMYVHNDGTVHDEPDLPYGMCKCGSRPYYFPAYDSFACRPCNKWNNPKCKCPPEECPVTARPETPTWGDDSVYWNVTPQAR